MNPVVLYASLFALVALYRFCCRHWPSLAIPLLLCASLGFYAYNDAKHLPLLAASLLFNFWVTGKIKPESSARRLWVALGIVMNLAPLLWYKYGARAPGGALPGTMLAEGFPLGLSFYTFQQITCLFDVQRRDAVRLSLPEHALFGSFFADIFAGPISRYRDLSPQIRRLGEVVPLDNVLAGTSLLVLGLAKKHFLADPLGIFVDSMNAYVGSGHEPLFLEGWLTAWGYLMQLYLDFSSYSDIAIGTAMCFGLALPVNFNSPLKATQGSEFVDRWHMSLVAWVREYLYKPMFWLVRKVPLASPDRRRTLAWAVATIVSMGVLGAWHGNSFVLLLSGLLSGLLLVLFQLAKLLYSPPTSLKRATLTSRLRRFLAHAFLLLLLAALSLATRARSPLVLSTFLKSLGAVHSISVPVAMTRWIPAMRHLASPNGLLPHVTKPWMPGALLLDSIVILFLPNTMQMFGLLGTERAERRDETLNTGICWKPTLGWGVVIGGLAALECLTATGQSGGFIYARF